VLGNTKTEIDDMARYTPNQTKIESGRYFSFLLIEGYKGTARNKKPISQNKGIPIPYAPKTPSSLLKKTKITSAAKKHW
jgi:hypothetical protein